jgi:hypothetical protein
VETLQTLGLSLLAVIEAFINWSKSGS